jgi:type II secretory pathway pseudopilin PulG
LLLLPSLSKARGKARLTACTNQLRQIGLAIALYNGDHEEYYPTTSWQDDSWDYLLHQYDGRESRGVGAVDQPEWSLAVVGLQDSRINSAAPLS